MALRWKIELFGGLAVRRGDQVLTRFRTQKTALLLAYLASHPHRAHPREALIELLWPESDPEVGRHKLSVALSSLRTQLEPRSVDGQGLIADGPAKSDSSLPSPINHQPSTINHPPSTIFTADRAAIGLTPGAVETDVAAFETALAAAAGAAGSEQAAPLTRALELYRGPFLDGYFDEWVLREQRHWEERFFHTARQLIGCLEQAGHLDAALHWALRAAGLDPHREDSHREVIRLYAALGQPAAAARQYQALEQALMQELGASLSAATRRLAEEIGLQAFGRSGVQAFGADGTALPHPPLSSHPSSLIPHPLPLVPHPSRDLEPIGGAVPLDSPFYITRDEDHEFRAAIARGDSLVLVKGARQTGKTSLLARGLQAARQRGARVVLTDFRSFNAMHLQSAEALLLALGEALGEQLALEVMPAEVWQPRRGPNPNFRRYLRREVLGPLPGPLVWGLDEIDRLFECEFGSEIFGMFRSWHNDRALDPAGPWSRLTLAIAYATEAHLFIKDPNQSPFNVGTRLALGDLTLEQVADLNARYGSPLAGQEPVAHFYRLTGGHPFLVRRGLHELATRRADLAGLEARAAGEDGIFGDHLRRLVALLARDPPLAAAMQAVLHGRPCPSPESFYRLRSAGLLTGRSPHEAQPRCQLYATHLSQRLL